MQEKLSYCAMSYYCLPVIPLSVPGAPLRVILIDIGPTTVRVDWTPDTLPSDDGGSPLLTVRLSYRVQGTEGEWSTPARADVGRGFYLVNGLKDQTTYQIKMEVGNDIGKGRWLAVLCF